MSKGRGLTAEQREADLYQKRSGRLADGLSAYMTRNKLTQQELATELRISLNSMRKLLNCEPTQVSIDKYWGILRAAGLRVTEIREDLWT